MIMIITFSSSSSYVTNKNYFHNNKYGRKAFYIINRVYSVHKSGKINFRRNSQ